MLTRHHKARLKERAELMPSRLVQAEIECQSCWIHWIVVSKDDLPLTFQCPSCGSKDSGLRADDGTDGIQTMQVAGEMPC